MCIACSVRLGCGVRIWHMLWLMQWGCGVCKWRVLCLARRGCGVKAQPPPACLWTAFPLQPTHFCLAHPIMHTSHHSLVALVVVLLCRRPAHVISPLVISLFSLSLVTTAVLHHPSPPRFAWRGRRWCFFFLLLLFAC